MWQFFVSPPQELRFIFPALPLFNLAAGVGMSKAVRGLVSAKAKDHDNDDDSGGGRTRNIVKCRPLPFLPQRLLCWCVIVPFFLLFKALRCSLVIVQLFRPHLIQEHEIMW